MGVRLSLVGMGLVLVGVIAPWAHTQAPSSGPASVGGLAHGGVITLICAAAAALMVVLDHRLLAAVGGVAAVAWTALVLYQLPEDLLQGPVVQADLAWGAYLALLGALVVLAAATLPRRRPAA